MMAKGNVDKNDKNVKRRVLKFCLKMEETGEYCRKLKRNGNNRQNNMNKKAKKQ